MLLGNHIALKPVMGWLCQERWKGAGRNEAVRDAAFGRNKSLFVSCPLSYSGKEELREME